MPIKKFSNVYVKIIFIILLFLIFTLVVYRYNFNNQINSLHGTYTCESLPFTSIVFNEKDNNSFYYYYTDSKGNQIEDKGIYSKKEDNIYTIKSNIFNNTEIICNKNKFFIKIDGKEYIFKKINNIPSIIIPKTS